MLVRWSTVWGGGFYILGRTGSNCMLSTFIVPLFPFEFSKNGSDQKKKKLISMIMFHVFQANSMKTWHAPPE